MFPYRLIYYLLFWLVRLIFATPEVDRRYMLNMDGFMSITLSANSGNVELLDYLIVSNQLKCEPARLSTTLILRNGSTHTLKCNCCQAKLVTANITVRLRDSINPSIGDHNRSYIDTFNVSSVLKLPPIYAEAEVVGTNATILIHREITTKAEVTVRCNVSFPDDTTCGIMPESTAVVKSVSDNFDSLLLSDLRPAHTYNCAITRREPSSIYDSDPNQFQLTTNDSVTSINQYVSSMPYHEEPCGVDCRYVTLYWTNPPECATNGAIRTASVTVFPLAPNGSRLASEPNIGVVRHSEAVLTLRNIAYDIELRVMTSRGVNDALLPTRVRVSPRPVALDCNLQQALVQVGSYFVSWRWPCRVRTPKQHGIMVTHARFCRHDEMVCRNFTSNQQEWHRTPLASLYSQLNITTADRLIAMLGVALGNGSQPMEATGFRRVPCFYLENSTIATIVPDFNVSYDSITVQFDIQSCKSAVTPSVNQLVLLAAPRNCTVSCGDPTPSCARLANYTADYATLSHSLTVQLLADTYYELLLCAELHTDVGSSSVLIWKHQVYTNRHESNWQLAILSSLFVILCCILLCCFCLYVRHRKTHLSKVRADRSCHAQITSRTATSVVSEPDKDNLGTLDLRDCGFT